MKNHFVAENFPPLTWQIIDCSCHRIQKMDNFKEANETQMNKMDKEELVCSRVSIS